MAAWVVGMETGGNTLVKYLDDNGEYQQQDRVTATSTAAAPQQGITDPTTKAESPTVAGPIPTNPSGSQVGSGTPWDKGADHPSGAPPGYTWDPNLAMYTATPGSPVAPSTQRPTGGTLTDPGYAAQYVAWAGTQPGVNPSVNSDPNYWISRFTSGAFGNDQDYALQRMMQAEGAPEGSQAAAAAPGAASVAGGAPIAYGTGAVAPVESEFTKYLRELIKSRLASAQTPVDPNSQNIAAPLSAARDEATRSSDKERSDLAERLYAQGGLNTNALNQGIQQSSERNAGNLSTLRGTLIMNAYNQKNQELQSLLQMALASGDAQSARDVQAQISNLNAQIQREGLGVTLAINGANQNRDAVTSALG